MEPSSVLENHYTLDQFHKMSNMPEYSHKIMSGLIRLGIKGDRLVIFEPGLFNFVSEDKAELAKKIQEVVAFRLTSEGERNAEFDARNEYLARMNNFKKINEEM